MAPSLKRKYQFSNSPVDYYKAARFIKKARWGKFKPRRAARPFIRRSRYTSRRGRNKFRIIANKKVFNRYTQGPVQTLTFDANGEYKGLLYINPAELVSQWPSADNMDPYTVMYDQFKIAKVTWAFWLSDTANFTVANKDGIISLYDSYDPDANGRSVGGFSDMLKMAGHKQRFMMPYKKVLLAVFPKWGNKLTTANSPQVEYKNNPWFDASNLKVDHVCMNGRQIFIKGGAAAQTISYQCSIHYKFRGLRQGQSYA